MLRIGITGGIATGKSTVSTYVQARGYPVLDADVVARQVVAPGQPGLARLVDLCGPEILTPAGQLDRGYLGARLFADATLRQAVDAALHPLIYQAMEAQAAQLEAQGQAVVFFDIPLLYETGYEAHLDAVWVVYVPATLQVERLKARNHWSDDQATTVIASQAPIEAKRQRATRVLDNQGSPAATFAQVEVALQALGL